MTTTTTGTACAEPRFSVIVPVYNRIDEVRDLVQSLEAQSVKNFELVVVEDGSSMPCRDVVEGASGIDASYYYKPNEGRSIARNYGMEKARGDYFVFFDSDCVIPPDYFEKLEKALDADYADCYGGPDAASESFSPLQKAISYAMTSFLTTGGIRGGKMSLEKFVPRTFNMGFSRAVYEKAGGFREMFSEDIDMSTRIRQAGFRTALFADNPVWHKRRVDLKCFWRQVHVFGMSRITLKLLYPDSLKVVHTLPALFTAGSAALIAMGAVLSPWWLAPLGAYFAAVGTGATMKHKSLKTGLLAVPAAAVQLYGYGTGFIRAWWKTYVLRKGRRVEDEIEMRKGR